MREGREGLAEAPCQTQVTLRFVLTFILTCFLSPAPGARTSDVNETQTVRRELTGCGRLIRGQ